MVEKVKYNKFTTEVLSTNIKDTYQDFYITKDKERMFFHSIKTAKLFTKMLQRGEVCFKDEAQGLLITYGIHDKAPRKYIKILAQDMISAKRLLTVFLYQYGNKEFFLKIKRNNPLNRLVQGLGFIFLGGRGNEILLVRKADKINRSNHYGDKENASDDFTGKRRY